MTVTCLSRISFPETRPLSFSISNDKDLQRMVKFHYDSSTVEIYVFVEEVLALEVSTIPDSRSSRTTLSETMLSFNTILNHDTDYAPPVASHDIIRIDADMEIPLLSLSSNEEKLSKGAQQWHNTITGVGQRFNSVHEFRETLRKYAIAHQFAFKYKKNDSHRVTIKCKAEGFPGRIHASRLSSTQLMCVDD